ncbi:PLP-dependent aminotransferase family protein [Achromobacter sp.]|uniref:aminotransferase-like domain-containing protein n=1 Tax=Achromobacter sp. TaxID=134375 RepID=UPI003C7090DF
MWSPDLDKFEGAIYTRIADALESDIRAERLLPGTRLPTLKELAATVGVTPGTVNRAYELAQRRGLVEGEVGRGTFVLGKPAPKEPSGAGAPFPAETNDIIDLSIVKPNLEIQEPYVRATLSELAQSKTLTDMLDYTPDGGHPLHRQAGASWIQQGGFPANAEQVILTAGAQHGLWVAVNALSNPGDLVLCESLCYPGVASVIHSLGRRIAGVHMDAEGMRPDHLRELCQRERPALVICIATCQNPTTAIMSVGRRKEVAQIARDFDIALLDDDLYGFLAPSSVPPLATFAPERTVYLTSLSKSVASTIRLGYMHCPPEWLPRMTSNVRTSIWMVSPLAAQIATTLISSGTATVMAGKQREEARHRQAMAREILGQHEFLSQPTAFHIWLKLPPRWSSGEHFSALARSHRLLIAGGDSFAVNRDDEGRQHVRITLMASTRERMRFVLSKLAGLIDTPESVWL